MAPIKRMLFVQTPACTAPENMSYRGRDSGGGWGNDGSHPSRPTGKTDLFMCIYIYIYIHVHTCIHISIYIYIYIYVEHH